MFVKQLHTIRPIQYRGGTKVYSGLGVNALEFQYDLCQIFLKKTGEQLHQKESEMMQESVDLLRSLKKRDSDKGACLSTDSGGESMASSLQEEQNFACNEFSKRSQGGVWRKLDSKIGIWLAEIEEKCSALCLVNIKAIINDYRKVLEKSWQIQARQGLLQRKYAHFLREQEQNLILKQKLDSQNSKIDQLRREVQSLKQKNETIINYANEKLKEMLGNHKMIEINQKVYRDVKNYLQDKEKNINRRMLRAQLLEQELIKKLMCSMPQDSCESCCVMLKRLKDSLLKFKKYLQGEGAELENLINKYKKTLFTQNSCSKLY